MKTIHTEGVHKFSKNLGA